MDNLEENNPNNLNINNELTSADSSKNDFDSNNENFYNDIEILSEQYKSYDLSFKIIVIGDSEVGKSCVTLKATKNTFQEENISTCGFEFFRFNVKIDSTIINLQIWDTCGQERYRSLIVNLYRGSAFSILVYAINKKQSFDNLEDWLKQVRTHASPDCKLFLIGNKCDLENEREVNYEDGENFSKINKFEGFMETSAKTGINTKELFMKIAKILYIQHKILNDNKDINLKENNILNAMRNKKLKNNKKLEETNEMGGWCC
jgi:small GTP-binding protein